MAELAVAQQLQYARLQMASEAFLVTGENSALKQNLDLALVEGNGHASAK